MKRTFGYDMHPLLLGMIWTFSAGGKLFAYQSEFSSSAIHTDISRPAIWCIWARASPSWSSSFGFYWSVLLAADRALNEIVRKRRVVRTRYDCGLQIVGESNERELDPLYAGVVAGSSERCRG